MSARASSVSEPHFGGDFWKFLTGQTISTLGSSFTTFALPLLIFQLTGSSLNLALTVAASVLPYLTSVLAKEDTFPRKQYTFS